MCSSHGTGQSALYLYHSNVPGLERKKKEKGREEKRGGKSKTRKEKKKPRLLIKSKVGFASILTGLVLLLRIYDMVWTTSTYSWRSISWMIVGCRRS